MLEERWIQFLLVAIIILGVEYLYPLLKRKTPFREGFFQDLLFWVILVDFYFLPMIDDHFEVKLHDGYQHFFGLGDRSIFMFSVKNLHPFLQFIIVFLVLELINYLTHRYIKHGPHFWDFHKTHHSSKELDQFSDARNHPALILFESIFFGIPALIILNPNTACVGIYGVISLVWGPLIHSNIRLRWASPFSYILSSPHTHRWHHSKEEGLRCNYAGIFIFYDYLFGTYYSPEESCKETGFPGDEAYSRSAGAMLLYPFKIKYNNFIKKFKLHRK